MSAGIATVPAMLADASGIARVHVASWQAAYAGIMPAEYLATLSVMQRESIWREAILCGRPEVTVARADSGVVGFVALGPARDADAAPTMAEIRAIYVSPQFWSRGVGRALWLEGRARLSQLGYRSVSLWVLAENLRAIRFYGAAGFVPQPGSARETARGGKSLREVRYVADLAQ